MNESVQYFEFKCWKGLKLRGLDSKPEYIKRLEYEIKIIEEMNFVDYFLIVQDFIQWSKRNAIMIGPGRGSIGGSLVAFCLYITEIDPLKYDLPFERFLNPGRKDSYPDADTDVDPEHRNDLFKYLQNKYGEDRVARIGTVNTMLAKSAIQKVCTALGIDISEGETLRKLMPAPDAGKTHTLKESYEIVPELKKIRNASIGPSYTESQRTQRKILEWAERFEGIISAYGVHAAGTVISNIPLTQLAPQYKAKDGGLATMWDMKDIEKIGLIKFDLLGLATLSKIRHCLDLILQYRNIEIDINKIPMEDPKVFETIQTGLLLGVFQMESLGMQQLVLDVKPTTIQDLSAILAIYRPGPLGTSGLASYLAWRNGAEPEYLVPELKPILADTGGFIIYQEQIMKIAVELAGYTMSEADTLRKAMGKKLQDVLDKEYPRFKRGWLNHALPERQFEILWEQLLDFAKYAFNRAHSVGYAHITYQTAYLKTYYPVEFLTACMEMDYGKTDQLAEYLVECKRLKLKVAGPSINKSSRGFKIYGENEVRFGLVTIKNIGEGPVVEILEKRSTGPFKCIEDFCDRVHLGKVNRARVEALVKSGAFDEFQQTRSSMLAWMDEYWEWMKLDRAYQNKYNTYKNSIKKYEDRLEEIKRGSTKKSLKKPEEPELPIKPIVKWIPEKDMKEMLQDEYELLGFFASSHPLDGISNVPIGDLDVIKSFSYLPNNSPIKLCCIFSTLKEHFILKSKQYMAFCTLEDLTGRTQGVIFPKAYTQFKKLIEVNSPIVIDGVLQAEETEDGNKKISVIVNRIEPLKIDNVPKEIDLDCSIKLSNLDKLTKYISNEKTNYKINLSVKINKELSLKVNKPIYTTKHLIDIKQELT